VPGVNFKLRDLPSVSSVLADGRLTALAAEHGLTAADLKRCAEDVLAALRDKRSEAGAPMDKDVLRAHVADAIADALHLASLRKLQPVINATGILVHTNLGRAPLGERLLDAVRPALLGYTNLEYELADGKRGKRGMEIERMLCALSGAEAALLVNNNAGAVFLILRALCAGREVVISRGELVQIGGGFRIPDIMAESGALMREVGTSNITTAQDYADALSDNTAAFLKVHRSNFGLTGFTADASLDELAPIAHEHGALLIDDMGAAALLPENEANTLGLPHPAPSLRAGADVVCFSADKILGLAQGGIILGKRAPLMKLRKSPLYRALRPDKSMLALIEAGLSLIAAGEFSAIPVNAVLMQGADALKTKAFVLAKKLRKAGADAEVVESQGEIGGGIAGRKLKSYAVVMGIGKTPPDALAEKLRHSRPPIIAVVREGKLMLDVLALMPGDDERITGVIAGLVKEAK
jgi:L-seryl-tRNA(Ser) seleniumtransferase